MELHKKKKINQLRKLAKLKGCALFVALNSAQIDKSLPIKEKRETKFQGIREASFHPHAHRLPAAGEASADSCIPAGRDVWARVGVAFPALGIAPGSWTTHRQTTPERVV